MALIKPVAEPDGVVTNYHRVSKIETIPHVMCLIEVDSYVTEDSRAIEILGQTPGYESEARPQYVAPNYYQAPYIDGMTLGEAYAYLLTQDRFSGATSDEGAA